MADDLPQAPVLRLKLTIALGEIYELRGQRVFGGWFAAHLDLQNRDAAEWLGTIQRLGDGARERWHRRLLGLKVVGGRGLDGEDAVVNVGLAVGLHLVAVAAIALAEFDVLAALC